MSKPRPNRAYATRLASEAIAQKNPLGWFEPFYAEMHCDPSRIPWADMEANPNLLEWLRTHGPQLEAKRVLVVGCGLGDDASALADYGCRVVAFDISPSAVRSAAQRFAQRAITFEAANLLAPPAEYVGAFDLVVEIYTLQVLPIDLRTPALRSLAACVASRGELLIIARGREDEEPFGELPWALSKRELHVLGTMGLKETRFEDYFDPSSESRRFRALYTRVR